LLTKQKRSKVTGTKCKQVQILYNKIVSLFQGIADLIPLGRFTDTIILAVSSLPSLPLNKSSFLTEEGITSNDKKNFCLYLEDV
jgi:hypothetical protein